MFMIVILYNIFRGARSYLLTPFFLATKKIIRADTGVCPYKKSKAPVLF